MSLQSDLKSEKVSHLAVSGFAQVALGTSVRDTLARMRADRRVVCLVVEEGGRPAPVTGRQRTRGRRGLWASLPSGM